MKKNFSSIVFFFLLTLSFSTSIQATETVTINSYLPGPIANVQTLRLNPHTETTTLGCLEGTTYIDISGNLKICKDNGAGSTNYYSPPSDWTSSGNYIYPTDTATNSNLRIGMGTSTPTALLDVAGNALIENNLSVTGELAVTGNATFSNITASNITASTITVGEIIVTNRGIVGTTNFSVIGSAPVKWYVNGPYGHSTLATVYQFPYQSSSDQRFKTDMKPLTNALDTIAQLNPVKYRWLDIQKDADGKVFTENKIQPKVNLGLLAQEVYKIVPEVVTKPTDESKELWSMSYEQLVPLLIQAAKEQKSEVEALKAEVENLKRELTTLKKYP